jgi:hypothetical protein
MEVINPLKKLFESNSKICPQCKNESIVPWKIKIHEGNTVSENPTEYVIGNRCERCSYTVVYKPMPVFALYTHLKNNNLSCNPDFDVVWRDMLTQAIERCVIDHRKDVIPKEIWKIVTPPIKKRIAYCRAKECSTSPLNTPEYWESEYELICYEAFGKCVWGFD